MMKTLTIKLPFGLNEHNIIVHIANVESGKSCNCFCPSCKSPLIAAKGTKNQHHFKHAFDNECEGGLESAIHLAAKQEIMERKKITLPEYISIVSAKDSRGKVHTQRKTVVQDEKIISFDSVQEEKELNGMRADILANKGGSQLIIEIFYRHKVEEQKIEKIKKTNTSAIEINLADLTPEDVMDMGTFWSCINDSKRVQWLHNVKAHDSIYPDLVVQLEEKIQKVEIKYEQEEIKKQKREQGEKIQLVHALEDLDKVLNKNHIAHLNKEAENHPAWKIYSKYLNLSLNELPNFLDLDAPNGDWIYGCDRRVWQTAVYSNFIGKNCKSYFSIKWVDDWLQNTLNCKVPYCAEIVGKFGRRHPELVPTNISSNIPSSWATLRAYFNHLNKLGILVFSGNDRRYKGSCWFEILNRNFNLDAPYPSSLIQKPPVAHGYQVGVFAAPADHVHYPAIALDLFR